MGDAEEELRDRLERVGLMRDADALVGLALPAVRLRGEVEPAGEVLACPPAAVWGLHSSVRAIAGCSGQNLVVRVDGTVVAWGYNERGQLGDGTTKYRRRPVPVCDLPEIVAVSAGMGHSLALTASGGVFAWGLNRNGQLGDATQTDRHGPVAVQGLERDVVAVAAGESVSLALMSDGSVFGWGGSPTLEFGVDQLTPIRCPGLDGIVAIAVGGSERLALTSHGTVLAWGSSPSDLQGGGGVVGPACWGSAPQVVEGIPCAVRAISAGHDHSLALTGQGSVFAWGQGYLGQLGDGTGERRYPAVQPDGLSAGVRAIAAGRSCSYAVTDDGSALSWGWNFDGRLGDGAATKAPNGSTAKRLKPTPVPALTAGVVGIAEFLALMGDGSVRAWGGEYQPDEHGADARLDLAATKLGGRPDLRARSRWPTRNGRPLSFVAQIDLAQLAPLDRTGVLPSEGLLSFFYANPADPVEPDLFEVLFSAPGTPLSRREFPDELPDHERYAAVALHPEVELTLPPEPPPFLSDGERDAYQYERPELPPGPRHRMLGHPDPVQNDPRDGDGAIMLLQVDSDDGARMTWGDVGRLYYLIEAEHLQAKSFDAGHCELQSH